LAPVDRNQTRHADRHDGRQFLDMRHRLEGVLMVFDVLQLEGFVHTEVIDVSRGRLLGGGDGVDGVCKRKRRQDVEKDS
jgi:hypothetical protein